MQIVFHIDLNAFFASAEASQNPELLGKPLVISGYSKRSIVTTASYEARKFGIHSAMPLFQALKLCKNLIVKPGNYELYHHLSSQFFDLLATYSDQLEIASIDECYLDVTELISKKKIAPIDLAKKIQIEVQEKLNLQCSIGIAPNKFLAKMASDMKKPMGITVLTKSNLKEILWPLPISDMNGIGKRTQPKLIEVGICTIGDIAKYENYSKLRYIFGKNAIILYRKANGIDNSKINISHNELKSVGNSRTLDKDTNNEYELIETLEKLSKLVSNRAIKRNLISNCISITIKFTRFESITRQTILSKYINDYETILSTAKMLFDNNYDGKLVRLLGVSLNNTINQQNHKEQLSLFEETKAPINKDDKINDLINDINSKLKTKGVVRASSLSNKKSVQNKYLKKDE